ncbi:MAG: nicotinamidase/pyrazinamidase [Solirubrobacteraceae bacterium]|nr:nicotinamidase/pyrazinamidase [Solirubrobacteraceae bacterium]
MGRALIVVDFQNDFIPGGALGVDGGDEIADRVNELAASGEYDLVIATRDWHPPDHGSFAAQGGPWPVHCVAGTGGAAFHPAFDATPVDVVIDKGQGADSDGYSGFDGTTLGAVLREHGIDNVTIVGLATDYCVRATAMDALRQGFAVCVDTAAVRAVNVKPGDGDKALTDLRAAGATVR